MKNLIRIFVVVVAAAALVLIVLRSSHKNEAEAQLPVGVASKTSKEMPMVKNENKTELASSSVQNQSLPALAAYLETVEAKFGLVLGSFNIAPERLARIKKLLAEREAAKADLTELRGSKDANIARDARGTYSKVDEGFRKEIQAALTPEEWQNVSRMLVIEGNLVGLEHEYASPLIQNGTPLSGSQLFSVADKVHAIYGDGVGNIETFTATIDPTSHLTASNEAILSQLSATLSPNQIALLRANLVARNERLLGVAGKDSKK